MSASASSIALSTLLQALRTSNTGQPAPSSAATMCAVAGSTASQLTPAKMIRSRDGAARPVSSITWRAAATAIVAAVWPGPARCRRCTPVACSMRPRGMRTPGLLSASRSSSSAVVMLRSGRCTATPATCA